MVAEPLTTMMCCPADDGAACVILAREDLVRSRQPGRRSCARSRRRCSPRATRAGHTFVGPVVGPSTMTRDTARECYEAAGIGPEDVSLAFCHDAFVNEELEYYELLGFCAEGEGDKLVEEGETGPGGRIPFNTDGGLHRARSPGRADRARADPRVGAAAAGRGDRPSGRRRARRARAPRRRRQHLHGEPARRKD